MREGEREMGDARREGGRGRERESGSGRKRLGGRGRKREIYDSEEER